VSRVLVVDDDRVTRHVLRGVLRSAGHTVASAADGVSALRQLEKAPPDLVLLDVWMPRMGGLDVLARLRERGLARPRVVVLTSDDAPETLLRAVREQAHLYLKKPVEPEELLSVVRSALAAEPEAAPIEVVSARREWVELLVPCERASAERIQAFMGRLGADLDEERRDAVGRVFRELLLNAIEWGGGLDPAKRVRVSYLRARRMLLYRIADPGQGFRLEELPHAAVGKPADQPFAHELVRQEKGLRPGGFGILLAQALVDELIYNERRNEVVFVKYLD
jgi:CheY-like chemotaxis protein/anti-sigma regulatory factor (Ser/Thr protein kinase)